QHSDSPLGVVEVIRSGSGLVMFLAGLLLLATSAIVTATALWRSSRYPKASGVPFAVGVSLYIPQFFVTQPLRVAHGLLVAAGCVWMAAVFGGESKATGIGSASPRRRGYNFPFVLPARGSMPAGRYIALWRRLARPKRFELLTPRFVVRAG